MRVAIYCRVSTDQQHLEPQLLELNAYAEARGWTVTQRVSDVISGSKSSRVGLDALMGSIRRKEIDCLLVVRIDRLARSLPHFAQICHELRKYDVALVVPAQGVDTSNANPAGRMLMNMLGVIADFERELIRERTKAGMAAAKARGARIGHPSQKLVPNHAEVLAEWRAEGGKHLRDLASRLGGVSVSFAHKLATGKAA